MGHVSYRVAFQVRALNSRWRMCALSSVIAAIEPSVSTPQKGLPVHGARVHVSKETFTASGTRLPQLTTAAPRVAATRQHEPRGPSSGTGTVRLYARYGFTGNSTLRAKAVSNRALCQAEGLRLLVHMFSTHDDIPNPCA